MKLLQAHKAYLVHDSFCFINFMMNIVYGLKHIFGYLAKYLTVKDIP
jgi:hypothetical protein